MQIKNGGSEKPDSKESRKIIHEIMTELEERILHNSTIYDVEVFNKILAQYTSTDGLTVYRGDNRSFDEISSIGFSPWCLMEMQNLISLAVDFVRDPQFRKDFEAWWKYPCLRTINMKNNPFVATGTNDAHLGKYKYKIQLDQFHVYHIQSGLFIQKIGFDGDSLDTSSIIAFQIDKAEVIFGTTIPAIYISEE